MRGASAKSWLEDFPPCATISASHFLGDSSDVRRPALPPRRSRNGAASPARLRRSRPTHLPAAPAQSRARETRGRQVGSYVLELPLGLLADAAYVPDGNPLSKRRSSLGKLLYFDPRLSKDGTLACAGAHNPYHGFADPCADLEGRRLPSLGVRNSPTVINRLFSSDQFWDGRARTSRSRRTAR